VDRDFIDFPMVLISDGLALNKGTFINTRYVHQTSYRASPRHTPSTGFWDPILEAEVETLMNLANPAAITLSEHQILWVHIVGSWWNFQRNWNTFDDLLMVYDISTPSMEKHADLRTVSYFNFKYLLLYRLHTFEKCPIGSNQTEIIISGFGSTFTMTQTGVK
jgi:hypothetical protein